jgi:hypothetical protein
VSNANYINYKNLYKLKKLYMLVIIFLIVVGLGAITYYGVQVEFTTTRPREVYTQRRFKHVEKPTLVIRKANVIVECVRVMDRFGRWMDVTCRCRQRDFANDRVFVAYIQTKFRHRTVHVCIKESEKALRKYWTVINDKTRCLGSPFTAMAPFPFARVTVHFKLNPTLEYDCTDFAKHYAGPRGDFWASEGFEITPTDMLAALRYSKLKFSHITVRYSDGHQQVFHMNEPIYVPGRMYPKIVTI